MMNVIGIGDNVVDKYVYIQIMYFGGNVLNFVVYVVMLGYNVVYLGIFGNDVVVEYVMQVLDKVGVKWLYCLQVVGENGCVQLKIEEGEWIFFGLNVGGICKIILMDFIFQYE